MQDLLNAAGTVLNSGKHTFTGVADNLTEHYIEAPLQKEVRLEIKEQLENFHMLAVASLVLTVTVTLFFSLFTMLAGGVIGTFLTLSLWLIGGAGSLLCYDAMRVLEKGIDITSHPKNFIKMYVKARLGATDQVMGECKKMLDTAVNDTILLKHLYISLGERIWTFITEAAQRARTEKVPQAF